MLHVSLHWSEYDVHDLTLWPFAVKHDLAEQEDLLHLNFPTKVVLIIAIFSELMSWDACFCA